MSAMNKVVCAALAFGLTVGVVIAAENAPPSASAVPAARVSRTLWSYAPVQQPALPEVKRKKWVRTPIDAFILAKLEEKGLAPSAEAERRVLIRRATLDVWGLIPIPEEVDAFVHDSRPDAYEKLVERLLASPRYAERQARRWLDLARYADSNGFIDDEARPTIWRYRDYVIDAFRNDKPFDLFVREQIAGDELAPGNQQALVATGFLRSYPDAPDHRDMVEKRYDIITDMTNTVGTVFLAQTVECARCHDHKSDRISQKEYFQLQSFFATTAHRDDLPVQQKGPEEIEYEEGWRKWEEASREAYANISAFARKYWEEATLWQHGRFFEDARVSFYKPVGEQDSKDRWLTNRFTQYVLRNNPGQKYEISFLRNMNGYFENLVARDKVERDLPQAVKDQHIAEFAQFTALSEELKKFDSLKPRDSRNVLTALIDTGPQRIAPTFVYFGGNHLRPTEEVQPGFPKAITPDATQPSIVPTATSSGRRLALANWIASAENPLTARVFVNRVWAQYFVRGIVPTVSDFGRAGEKPSHPELLDYLAADFVKSGWSIKSLHRKILLSSVYRQASTHRPEALAADPQNVLLAVFPRHRLEAEQIRDSLLVATGLLEDKVGGPSVFPPIPDSVMKQSTRRVPGFWPVSKNERDHYRRSLYVFTRRSVPYPMLEAFNMASPQLAHSVREVSTTPQQALTLFNNDDVYRWSKSLAGRALREAGGDESAALDRLYAILYARAPDRFERKTLLAYLGAQTQAILSDRVATGTLAVNLPVGLSEAPKAKADPVRLAAFVDLAHTLANANEFTYRY